MGADLFPVRCIPKKMKYSPLKTLYLIDFLANDIP